MVIKAVLFDIDGTLVDSNDYHVRAWAEAFRTVDADFEGQVIHDQIGKGADMLVPTLLPEADEDTQNRLSKAHGEAFKAYIGRVQAFPKAHELLRRVHDAGQRVVLASSASSDELEHYLDLLDARDIVSATTSADDVARTKPAPDIFAAALEKIAPLTAEEVLVVGDTPYDVEAAAKAGVAAVAVRSGGFAEAALRKAGAVAIYDDVAALLADFDASPLAR
ncbi:MAG: HAD family hydrolase [Caulobacteraceae bacterium]